jgi:hypothetical protein
MKEKFVMVYCHADGCNHSWKADSQRVRFSENRMRCEKCHGTNITFAPLTGSRERRMHAIAKVCDPPLSLRDRSKR